MAITTLPRLRAPGLKRQSGFADWRLLAAIAGGGAVGALARAALEEALPARPGEWPQATFAVNVVGSFLLGYFLTRLLERLPLSTYKRPFLGTGFCGALTTFSSFQLEIIRLAEGGFVGLALAYAAASIAAGFGAVLLATALVRRARLVQ